MTQAMVTENAEQAALWNGAAGIGWAKAQAVLDTMFQPFADLLAEQAVADSAARVLDIGCGAGTVSLAVAGRLGAGGRCTGIDISAPLIALARARAAGIDFVCADAQSHDFAPACFDLLVSRFGVSFFADPVRAFANLHRAAKKGAALKALTWRGAGENPFMTAAEEAVAPLMPAPRAPDAPGPFALADEARITGLLAESGWREIAVSPLNRICVFPGRDLLHYLAWVGPVGRMLQAADDDARARIMARVRPAFDRFVQDGEVRFTAACWMIEACRD